jgi:hypothetical protein
MRNRSGREQADVGHANDINSTDCVNKDGNYALESG